MKSNVIMFFGNALNKASENLTDEQLGKALRMLATEANGDRINHTPDKQVFFAYKILQSSMDYLLHSARREYMHKQNELTEAKLMNNNE